MADERVPTALDRLVPPVPAANGWDDVLRRARRLRRRRRELSIALAAAGAALVLAASLAAGPLAPLLSHTTAPHLVVRGALRLPDGGRAGSIAIELPRASVTLRGRPALLMFRGDSTLRGRWFLDLDPAAGARVRVTLRLAATESPPLTLCDPCAPHASGRIELTSRQVDALVSGHATVRAGAASGGASASLELDRAQLRRGVVCELDVRGGLDCSRMYTGR